MVQKITRIPLRKAFPHEARHFSTWLEENIDVLNDVLDISLSNPERERSAGDFSIDIVAEDELGQKVIIENQLEKSNHDHLGKVITYLVAMDAKTAIWIVSEPRPEHVSAISWLNETTEAAFYLIKVEAIQIDNSEPAPLLTLIVGPSEESKAVGKAKQEFAERYDIRRSFWSDLLKDAKSKTKLHSTISPSKYAWIAAGAGKSGLSFNYVIWEHKTAIELYIDKGKDYENETKDTYDQLAKFADQINSNYGESLEWQRLDSKRACRIRKTFDLGGFKDQDKWVKVIPVMTDAMVKFEKILNPYIKKLP
jgi:hypothetical protein